MTTNPFKRATKSQAKLRMAIMGPSGSGKTYTSLTVATALGNVAVIDTEHGSASKYGDRFTFDVLELTDYHPQQYIDAIQAAGEGGYDVLVIDSLSHAWNGAGGVLEIVDRAARRSESKNTFSAWRDATPLHNQLVEALLSVPLHLICTLRSKTEYVLERDERGKMTPRKVGLAPIQREGMEYEFDVVAEMDVKNTLMVGKTRIPALSGKVIPY
ncbi:MAG: ATP-binding protein, partial [Anaerolineae bacterium]|nr:ATP-binding protein [Anaerolineae bacterium]